MPARNRNRPDYTAGRLIVSMKRLDKATSKHLIVSIEHGRLARSNGPLGSPESNAEFLFSGRAKKSLRSGMPMPDLHRRLFRAGGRFPRDPVHPRHPELRPVLIGLRAHDDLPLLGANLQNVPRLRPRETQSFPLTYREKVDSFMSSEDRPFAIHDLSSADSDLELPLQEVPVASTLRNKADVLALRLGGHGQPGTGGQGSHLRLHQIAYREDRALQLLPGETEQKVRLVLLPIHAP